MKIAVLVLLLAALDMASAQQQVVIAGREVALTVVSKSDRSSEPWPARPFQLNTANARIGSVNVLKMLEANGILADSQAIALVYDLNPEVRNLDTAGAGRTLKLPKVRGEEASALIARGELVELTVDPELRNEISQLSTSLQPFAPQVPNITSDAAVQAEINELIEWYGTIGSRFADRGDPPLTHETMIEMKGEGQALNATLSQATAQQRKLTEAEVGQVGAIHSDMGLVVARFKESLGSSGIPNAEDRFQVQVTIMGGSASQLVHLRVYYECTGLFVGEKPPKSYQVLGDRGDEIANGKTYNLPKKNYHFWVAPGDNGAVILSDTLPVQVGASSPIPVHLVLKGQ